MAARAAKTRGLLLRSLAARLGEHARNAVAVAVVALLFAELLLYGGDRREVALAFSLTYCLVLALLLSLSSWAPRVVSGRPELRPVYLLFAAAVAAVGLQFLPFAQGMAEGAWAAAGAAPAITIDTFATGVELLKLGGLAAVFMLGALIGAGEGRARAGLAVLGLMGVAYAGWALWGFYRPDAGGGLVVAGRLSGSLLSPNTTASALAVFATVGWTGVLLAVRGAVEASPDPRRRVLQALARGWPGAVLAMISIWALALTASRGGLLAALAGFVAAAAAVGFARGAPGSGAEARQTIAAAAGAVLVLAIVFVVSQAPFAARLGAYQVAVADRNAYIDLYLSHLRDVPWTGLGLGSFARFNPLMLGSSAPAKFWELGAMHNVYLQWIYEAGVAASAAMFACIGWALALIVRGALARGGERPWLAASLGASAVMLTHGWIDFDLQIHALAALWALMLGAGVGAAQRERSQG